MGHEGEIKRPAIKAGTTVNSSCGTGNKYSLRPQNDAVIHANQALTLQNLPHRILD